MKKLSLIAVAVAIGIGICAAQELDRLLAAVNGRVITEVDLKTARTLRAVLDLGRNEAALSEKEELDKYITQELIRQEMENFPIPQAEVQAVVQGKIDYLRNTYAEIGGLPALLRQLGLEEDELRQMIRIIVLSERFISLRFGPFITVSAAEVETYYREKLLPTLQQMGQPAPPLAERASEIEVLLREEKKTAAWIQWLENIRSHSRIEIFADLVPSAEKKQP